jgi:hypothetical protein
MRAALLRTGIEGHVDFISAARHVGLRKQNSLLARRLHHRGVYAGHESLRLRFNHCDITGVPNAKLSGRPWRDLRQQRISCDVRSREVGRLE